jgi:hypothetical protein
MICCSLAAADGVKVDAVGYHIVGVCAEKYLPEDPTRYVVMVAIEELEIRAAQQVR